MAVEVNFIEEVRARIAAAMVGAGVLSSVKSLRVGFYGESRAEADLPYININITAATLDYVASNSIRREEVTLEILLVAPKLDIKTNVIYNNTDSSGSLPIFSALKNVIEKDTSGVIDPGFATTVESLLESSYDVTQESKLVIYRLTLRAKTKKFISGGR